MMTSTKTVLGVMAALTVSTPAFADGDHSHGIIATTIHWLSSPAHSLFAVIGGVVISALIYKALKKKA